MPPPDVSPSAVFFFNDGPDACPGWPDGRTSPPQLNAAGSSFNGTAPPGVAPGAKRNGKISATKLGDLCF